MSRTPRLGALLALVGVTAVWGFTFVQVKDAVAFYPVFAFLAVRFAIGTAVLAVPAWGRVRGLGRRGVTAGLGIGLVLAAGYAFQTLGLERTTASSAGFITGLFVVITPLLATALFGIRLGLVTWLGVAVATVGLGLLSGGGGGEPAGDALVLVAALAFAVHIVLLERFAPGYDALALTALQLLAACVSLGLVAVAAGQVEAPRGWTVWSALVVTGVFASALGFLVQTWAQQRTTATRTALALTLEPVWAGFFGFVLAGDRLGWVGWAGAALIMAGIVLAEPAAAESLRRLVRARVPARR
jgi:drug/metabolite transporter (DMT)-like permease